MNVPAYRVDDNKHAREPVLIWEGTSSAGVDHRLVVTYSVAGNPPRIVLEKKLGHDALGNDRWDTVLIPDSIPRELFAEFIEIVTQDENILK